MACAEAISRIYSLRLYFYEGSMGDCTITSPLSEQFGDLVPPLVLVSIFVWSPNPASKSIPISIG